MRRALLAVLTLLLVVLVIFVVRIGEQPVLRVCANKEKMPELIRGRRVELSEPPFWTQSGAWALNGESLLLVDALRGQIRGYDLSGQFTGTFFGHGKRDPIMVHNGPSGSLWIEYEDGLILRMATQVRHNQLTKITGLSGKPGKLLALFGWVPLTEREVLGFCEIQRGANVFGAIVRVDLDVAGYEVIREVQPSSVQQYFRVGQQYIAQVNGQPYFVLMERNPVISRHERADLRLLRGTAHGVRPFTRPELPLRVTMEKTRLLFSRLQASDSPAGLYGWNGFLYLLAREPAEGGGTIWSLVKIDPESGRATWNRRIDSRAAHMFVIPGDRYWAFVEKGPVLDAGQQEVKAFMIVPSKVIEEGRQ